ncbi:MAG: acetyl-CoA carboxylase, biotin carboxyl carrier protein [Ruminococcus sp.]|jgi:acetyl-CoA carboxylase biotin carboxyl carrier protein|nr:acetyl-CoA carboxylase, biotin carboxyl carrier protein [Ruminococcus sp.]
MIDKLIEDDIRSLAQIMNDNGLTRIELENKKQDYNVILEKKFPRQYHGNNRAADKTSIPQIPQNTTAVLNGNIVKAPLIGTFYESASPGKPPFVTVGQTVKKGDILFIIESMKVMNEVPSEFDGTVKEILVKDAEPLEFDQDVMIISR